MVDGADNVVFVALVRQGRREVLHAWAPDTGEREWSWEREERADPGLRELLHCSEGRPMVSLQGARLAELLSRSEILPLARKALGQLRDLRELGLVWSVPTAPFPPLPVAAAEQTPGEGSGVRASSADATGVPEALTHTHEAYQRVLRSVGEADEEYLRLIGPLLSDVSAFAWLPWPEGSRDVLGILQVGKLLPKKPPGRKRDASRESLVGDLADLTESVLSPGGVIEGVLPAYEHRQGQVDMARQVADSLKEGTFLLAEAGTGVGKSLAYLVPAILWARSVGEPVVVSTNTKNLQEQLIGKDIPLLREALGVSFEAALLKGRGNYPCVRALVSAAVDAANSLFRGERLAAAHLLAWLTHSATGDLDEIAPEALEAVPELVRMVARVRSQGDACLGRACSHSDSCPVEIARGYARRADIIVANHALTFADAKTTVFPPYSRLIFDEAQNIEAAATEGLALECSSYGLSQLARTLADDPNSLMRVMERKLANLGGAVGVAEAADALRAIPPATDQLLNAASEFGATLCEFCFLASQDRRAEEGRTTIRLTTQTRALPEWHETAEMGGVAHAAGTALFGVMADFVKRLGEVDKGGQPGAEGIEADAFAMKTRLEEQLVALNTVLNATGDSTEYVTWADTWRSARGQQWGLHAAPVDVGPVLDEALYQHKAGIVFTSATVTVDGEFRYFRQRLGLDEYSDKLQEMRASSPFDLTEQLLLCIPTDMPDAAEREFNEKTADALRDICEATEGGTLALFTARSRMQQAFQRLEADLEGLGLTPLCQDVSGARWALLERLKQDPRAVLFGLKSFWEGVDVPGDALRCVVICKLPFAVPSDPIIEARQEDAARKGLNPMQDYYIPEAVIGFKQGFGRLIRTTTDTGVVFVLDKRILTKPYGRRFFRSIERCELVRDSLEECLTQTRGWLRK